MAVHTWKEQLHGQPGLAGTLGAEGTVGAVVVCQAQLRMLLLFVISHLVFMWLDTAGCSCCPQSRLVLRVGFACMKSAFSEAVSDSFFPFPRLTALGKNYSDLHTQ